MPRQETVTLSPEVIKYTRSAMQMTQQEFGEYLGVEANTVYRWEAGVHLPVGRKAREIVKRYRAALKNAKQGGDSDADSGERPVADLARESWDNGSEAYRSLR